ncbi:GT2 family glycosyltransferase [Paenibacillus rhizosphaerae]|uniref:GT2 family glycosyltransferase n=1 Tax=Paenibacillus rhizosphaerae TaxID=297318 RepID=A0A839U239_9BACL|nr:glycosyltransferase family 2 protein [Paenibacillus rhizosphaerae]MBB3130947.1 GT2 family glycosyltransferase [Paenibacillus rhizosphaerae]
MNKRVSVHIVTFNSGEDIIPCLKAVQAQTYPIEEIVIVDNHSTDDTLERILCLQNTIGEKLKIIINQENLGFAPGHNQAIGVTDSDYILVLNPDVTLDPSYVELLINSLETHLGVGSATGKLLLKSNPEIVDSTGLIMNKAYRAFDRGAGEPSSKWNQSGEVFGVSGAAAMYSRKMIQDISINEEFFDGDFFAYKEDVDVAWRAQVLGWKSYFHAEAIGYHARGWKKGTRQRQPLFIRRYSYINRYKMIYKNSDRFRLLLDLALVLPYEIASNGYFLLREVRILGAWKLFIKQYSDLKSKRKAINEKQSMR